MSYDTRVTFESSEAPPGRDEVATVVRPWLTAQRIYAVEYVLEDFLRGWTEGHTVFQDLIHNDIEGIMTQVSDGFPGIVFSVRGMGEEFHDVWLRQFQSGRIVFSIGPFEESTPPVLAPQQTRLAARLPGMTKRILGGSAR